MMSIEIRCNSYKKALIVLCKSKNTPKNNNKSNNNRLKSLKLLFSKKKTNSRTNKSHRHKEKIQNLKS